MNDHKICFIICTNQPEYFQECMRYLNHLEVPRGYEIDCISVEGAVSMTSGYNEGMQASDAKYKVYLHQDVFIVNRNFISNIIHIFEDDSIGMIGMVGSANLPEHAIPWYGFRTGRIYSSSICTTVDVIYCDSNAEIAVTKNGAQVVDVEALDGLLMATQYDIPWREDLFHGWDHYDLSQSQEFRRSGYRVVVPVTHDSWVIHDDGFINLEHYYESRRTYIEEYGKPYVKDEGIDWEFYKKLGMQYVQYNRNQAYLCYEQAIYYCEDARTIEELRRMQKKLWDTGEIQVRPVSIVILSYNICEIMQQCIESIRSNNAPESYEIVVVDNGSTDGVAEWLQKQGDIILQCNAYNAGFAKGCNQGIALADHANDIMLLNNDTVVPCNALFWMRMALYERDSIGAVGPMTSHAVNKQMLARGYESIEQWLYEAHLMQRPMKYPYENKLWLVGFAMLIRRKAINEIGGLDTRYEWGNYEDNDYGMALTAAGYEILLVHNSFIYHHGSVNMSKDMNKYRKYMMMNRKKLVDKWGFDVENYCRACTQAVEAIEEPKMSEFRFLEIGCGCGATLGEVQWNYPNSHVCGLEEDEQLVPYAKYMGEVKHISYEDDNLPFEEHSFDYILWHEDKDEIRNNRILEWIQRYIVPQGNIIKIYCKEKKSAEDC